jgi:ketosteroid isomerase-like protein
MRLLHPAILSLCALPLVVSADLTHDVRCAEIGFSKSAEARDADAFAAFIDDDARFVATKVSRGVDEVLEAWQPYLADGGPAIRWRPEYTEVLDNGKLAFSRGPYRITVLDEAGDLSQHWGTFNSVWRLGDDGRWRVVFDAGSRANEKPTIEQFDLLESEDDQCDAQDP